MNTITSTITSSKGHNDMKRTWKNIIQIKNVNKRFTTFVTTIKHKKHIDNRAKISENSHEFLRSFVKSLKVKFLHPMKWSVRMLSFKMRNLRGHKNDIFDHQSRGSLQSSAFRSTCPQVFYKKVALNDFEKFTRNTCVGVFFNKVPSLTLLKTGSGTFSVNFTTF